MSKENIKNQNLLIAVDYGSRHLGFAVANLDTLIPEPFSNIKVARGADVCSAVLKELLRIEEHFASGSVVLVVGLPLNSDGSENEYVKHVKDFACLIEKKSGIVTKLMDERFSSVCADLALRNFDMTRKKRDSLSHSFSASIILSKYIEQIYRNSQSL